MCAEECSTCIGSTINECTSCTSFNGSDYYLIHGTTICNQTCPDGQYEDETDNKCKVCNTECLTCSLTSSNCTTCGRVNGIKLYLENNTCVATCASGSYMNSSNNECEICAEGCLTCNGPTLNDCQSCNSSYNGSQMYYKYIGEDTCATTCPRGQYINSDIDYRCQQCYFLCQACVTRADNCVESEGCPNGFFFYNVTNSCRSSCPDGTYADLTTSECLPCADGCELCYGSGNNKCTRCGPDSANSSIIYYKHPRLDTCT
jgi:proprotein convertase subtilisin/kexin type 5